MADPAGADEFLGICDDRAPCLGRWSMDAIWWVLSVLLIVVGIAGTVLPALPGPAFVLAGVLLAAWIEGFTRVGVVTVAMVSVLAVMAWILDYAAAMLGAKRAGASRQALAGAADVERGPEKSDHDLFARHILYSKVRDEKIVILERTDRQSSPHWSFKFSIISRTESQVARFRQLGITNAMT